MAEIYVYRNVNSTGARDLAVALGGKRVKVAPKVGPRDFVVCWGSTMIGVGGARILNNTPILNKYEDALKLKQAGVSTIEVALRQPRAGQARPVERLAAPVVVEPRRDLHRFWQTAMDQANDFVENDNPKFDSPVFKAGVNVLRDSLVSLANALVGGGRVEAVAQRQNVVAPAAPQVEGEWLGRRFHHVGGKDLLGLNKNPAQYFVKKEDIVEEFRLHCFLGKSIRAGTKVHRAEVPANRRHAWIRSWDGGWKMDYGGFKSTKPMRELAAKAVAALGLDFGAVDIGKTRGGKLIVLEVNRAPGIEGNTVVAYKEAIERWMGGI